MTSFHCRHCGTHITTITGVHDWQHAEQKRRCHEDACDARIHTAVARAFAETPDSNYEGSVAQAEAVTA